MADEQNPNVPQDAAAALEETQSPMFAPGSRRAELDELRNSIINPAPDAAATIADLNDVDKVAMQNWVESTGLKTAGEIEKAGTLSGFSPPEIQYARRIAGVEDPGGAAQAESQAIMEDIGIPVDYGYGEEPQEPIGQDTVLAQETEDRDLQFALEEAEAAMDLDAEMQQRNLEKKEIAAQKAMKNAAANHVKAEAEAKKKVMENDAEARQAVLEEDDEEGLSFRQAFSILLGGIAQGLIGGENQGMVMLEKMRARKEKKRQEMIKEQKLSEEQKLAREKADMERLKFQLDVYSKGISNQKALAEISKLNMEAQKGIQAIQQKQMLAQRGASGVTPEELNSIVPDDDREFYVRNPMDERFYKVNSKNIANALTKELGDMSAATVDLSRLRTMVDEVGNNPITKVFDRQMIAEAESLQQSVIGSLRVAIFGPGVITDNERAIAERVIRNPTKFISLASANRKALDTIIKKVNATMRAKLRASGANLPKNDNEKAIDRLLRAFPKKYSGREGKAKAANDLIKAGMWKDYQ